MNLQNNIRYTILTSILLLFGLQQSTAQVLDHSWEYIVLGQEDEWFASEEAQEIAENVLLYQRNIGGWPKNVQMQQPLTQTKRAELTALKPSTKDCTTDNGATYLEMIYLSRCYKYNKDQRYKTAFLKGIDYLLEAQYENGGWPQFYPLRKGYYSRITYNDGSMVNIMRLFKELIDGSDNISITLPDEIMAQVKTSFDKGVKCILKTQYRQNGILTSWCAQYDENTLKPAKARAYELPSLSGKESAGIVLLLMSIDRPSPEIITSVNSAATWFEKVKITGKREDRIYNDKGELIDKKLVNDDNAPALWARFMDLDTNTPFFCDRDGIKKASLDEIGLERKLGYGWYTTDPQEVLLRYPQWKEINEYQRNTKAPKDEYNIVVAKDGTGDYTRIQDAINNSKSFPYQRVTIRIKNGVYNEKVKIHEWNTKISLIGESKEKTIITFNDYFDKINLGRNSTFHTYTMLVEGDEFYASNLTIENAAGEVGQGVALAITGDRAYITNCNILGNQDTIYLSGENHHYFTNCFIEGTTDYIFGNATALFENCIIHSKKDSYITAASTPKGTDYGFVFKGCTLTAAEGVTKVYLGRPWRIYARTVFINCKMGAHILPEGWHNWSKEEAETTTFYAEYENSGIGYQPEQRVSWSHQLKKSAIKKYTSNKILGFNIEAYPEDGPPE